MLALVLVLLLVLHLQTIKSYKITIYGADDSLINSSIKELITLAVKLETMIKKYIGTSAERIAMVTTYVTIGSVFEETDTELVYKWNGSAWYIKRIQGKSSGTIITATITRPNNISGYTAGDVVGQDPATNMTFSNVAINTGANIIITSISLAIDVATVPTGMLGFRLHLYNAAPTPITDNAAYNLTSGDRTKYLGYIDIDTPEDLGDTLFVCTNNINFQTKLVTTTLYAMLQTKSAYTPTEQAVKNVTIKVLEV
jgi:hypothetical protein